MGDLYDMEIAFCESIQGFIIEQGEKKISPSLLRIFLNHWSHGKCNNLHHEYIKSQWEKRCLYHKNFTIH